MPDDEAEKNALNRLRWRRRIEILLLVIGGLLLVLPTLVILFPPGSL